MLIKIDINYNKYLNIKKLLDKNYNIIVYNSEKIKFFLINFIKKTLLVKIFFINSSILFSFCKIKIKFPCYIFFYKTENTMIEIINLVKKLININPILYIKKNIFLEKFPINDISKLSKEILIDKFNKILLFNINRLVTLLKQHELFINR